MKAGMAISPDTPSSAVTDEIAKAADMILVMTVYPGESMFPLLARPQRSTRILASERTNDAS